MRAVALPAEGDIPRAGYGWLAVRTGQIRLEPGARIVTFANGMTAKELIVDVDDAARRLVWSVVEGRPQHHNGSIQIFPEGGGCRLVWIADILPHDLEKPIRAMMQHGMDAMKRKLEGA